MLTFIFCAQLTKLFVTVHIVLLPSSSYITPIWARVVPSLAAALVFMNESTRVHV